MNELTMAASTATSMTVEEFRALPDVPGVQRQLLDGEVVEVGSPVLRHQHAVVALVVQLHGQLAAVGARVVVAPMDLVLGPRTLVQPDILVFDAEAAATLDPVGWPEVMPVIVVEVLSPSTARIDLLRKRRHYEQAGIAEYWVVSCEERTIDVLRRTDDGYTEQDEYELGATVTTPIFPDVAVRVDDVVGGS